MILRYNLDDIPPEAFEKNGNSFELKIITYQSNGIVFFRVVVPRNIDKNMKKIIKAYLNSKNIRLATELGMPFKKRKYWYIKVSFELRNGTKCTDKIAENQLVIAS